MLLSNFPMTPAAHSKISIRNRCTSPSHPDQQDYEPLSDRPTQGLILSATEGLCLKYHDRVRRMSFFKFIRIFCGSHSYLIVAQCSDGAWIPTPAHQGNPISILGFTHKHLTGWDIRSNHSHPLFSQTGVFP